MDGSSERVAAAFSQMRERRRFRSRTGGRLQLVHSGRWTLDRETLATRRKGKRRQLHAITLDQKPAGAVGVHLERRVYHVERAALRAIVARAGVGAMSTSPSSRAKAAPAAR